MAASESKSTSVAGGHVGEMVQDLFLRVIPFWIKHSIDPDNGGFFDCLDVDGTVFDTTKHVWLQGRQVWMLSKMYNNMSDEDFKKNGCPHTRAELLKAAEGGIMFLRKHAIDASTGQVYFGLTAEGLPAIHQRKIFSGCFMVMALFEYGVAVSDDKYIAEARELLAKVQTWIKTPGSLKPVLPGEPDVEPLNVPMILLNIYQEMSQGDVDKYKDEKRECAELILKHHCEELKLTLENIKPDGTPDMSTPATRQCNPGHAIEAAWFLLEYAVSVGDEALQARALTILDESFELGWDKEHGGLLYFVDAKGFSPVELEWNMKLWWPHCEALIAFAMAYKVTKREEYLKRFSQVAEYALPRFSDKKHGGWFGYLDRGGEVTHRFKGGPYKGFFHVPRCLYMCMKLVGDLAE